jgi:formamidopyrimidine-DNA glycosylase
MPELPEVETTRRGIEPHVLGQTVIGVVVREHRLRRPVPARMGDEIRGQRITGLRRRAKYLLLDTTGGTAIVHLGMSGSLRIVPASSPPGRHDHADIVLSSGRALRLRDPRRFGVLLWTRRPPEEHELLRVLGPEPFGDDFDGDYLYRRSRGRRIAVKSFLMNSHIVAGLGNIYVNEALHLAGIHPSRAAGRVGRARYARLAGAVCRVLEAALAEGGTTLRDFVNEQGRPGYFRIHLRVYERAGKSCLHCGHVVRALRHGQRSTYYCPHCQH